MRNHISNVKVACTEKTPIVFTVPEIVEVSSICPEIRDFICVENGSEKRDLKFLEGYDLIPEPKYSEAANLLTSIGKFIDLHYLFELEDSLQESIRWIYKNDFRTIRSILGSYLEEVQLWRVGKKLNTKIDDEVKEYLYACSSVVGDLRDCGYLPKSTRCADPWISNKAISLKTRPVECPGIWAYMPRQV